ncbi:NAD-dependent succinate-semialdehyde dehydrogenase [Micromonospora yangpuensis]|uniref:Succinate-semialdehyde dehydrogenase / glutarate-semialdehyde dehydrogenase n=2 Tax=Micromonospora TaxID=1873 RepID=A0A1C6UVS4_9ACTN|nr:NAD-dependent succinate-semialdehyde dehydrogenase [Micromonospora yangpuensis]GGM25845.1 succinate-semialdehyde dehydrogenase [Micromonospora yangpuensis]SCL58120.1 succinate-semialdehyde dehydrogenase / glutarate-semialdehyde dehydrogenase [Micromonospora yangpuensis]
MPITTVNPATGAPLARYDTHDDDRVEHLLARAHVATRAWGRTPLERRVAVLHTVAGRLRADRDRLARLITEEMGKPLAEARAELEKSAATCDFYAERAAGMLGDEPVDVPEADAWVAYEPMGLVLAVMPWNFPFWQVMRFAVPSVVAGNGVFLKHSPNVTGCALEIERLFRAAGLPEGVLTTVLLAEPRVPEVTARLIADDRIAAVTLTGSTGAGAAVAAAAGRAVKKSVLELGGSDAFVVLADADVEAAAATAVRARFLNAGQSCVCAKRFVVEEPVADRFTAAFVAGVRALVVGDPTDSRTDVGPMARADLRDGLDRQVAESVAAGARVLTGGGPLPGAGFFYRPTVLADAGPGVAAFDEETFGPVATLTVAADEEHAVRLANASPYGLGLSVWTGDRKRGAALARRVTTGAAFVNAMVVSDPRLPFGGTRRSGYGRELAAVGLREFVNVRTYWAAH